MTFSRAFAQELLALEPEPTLIPDDDGTAWVGAATTTLFHGTALIRERRSEPFVPHHTACRSTT